MINQNTCRDKLGGSSHSDEKGNCMTVPKKENKNTKNKGRPRKSVNTKLGEVISATFTKADKAIIIEKAKAANVSPSQYMRQAVLTGKVIACDPTSGVRLSILQQALSEIKATRNECHKIERMLRKGQSDALENKEALVHVSETLKVLSEYTVLWMALLHREVFSDRS